MSRDSKTSIIPEKPSGFTVHASPFNPVKLELGAILIIGVVLLLIIGFIVDSRVSQLGILGCYGVSAMVWMIVRVKKIMQAEQLIELDKESENEQGNERG
ncbi:MAG: hypothetical protein OEM38_09520 [Gammaproteobacteria bacterium]|nr:hypothetical protein [Gammaproteobacteria bacterium]